MKLHNEKSSELLKNLRLEDLDSDLKKESISQCSYIKEKEYEDTDTIAELIVNMDTDASEHLSWSFPDDAYQSLLDFEQAKSALLEIVIEQLLRNTSREASGGK